MSLFTDKYVGKDFLTSNKSLTEMVKDPDVLKNYQITEESQWNKFYRTGINPLPRSYTSSKSTRSGHGDSDTLTRGVSTRAYSTPRFLTSPGYFAVKDIYGGTNSGSQAEKTSPVRDRIERRHKFDFMDPSLRDDVRSTYQPSLYREFRVEDDGRREREAEARARGQKYRPDFSWYAAVGAGAPELRQVEDVSRRVLRRARYDDVVRMPPSRRVEAQTYYSDSNYPEHFFDGATSINDMLVKKN